MNNANFVILGFSVAKHASHGRVAASGSSFTYTPAKGFTGSDSFSIEIDFLSGDKDVLVNFLDVTMNVTP
jgi:Bacterial Ig domain